MFLLISLFFSNNVSRSIQSIADLLSKSAKKVSGSSNTLNANAAELSELTNEQASSLQETVSSVDEISAMVSRNTESSIESKKISENSESAARDGKNKIDRMVKAIDEISSSNHEIMNEMENNNNQISEIIQVIAEIESKTKVINDIVFQTKLLSFNASVEAARAGEHGKGFAVVAEEVGNLAQVSGDASEEISSMLESSITKVKAIVDETSKKVGVLIESGKEKVDKGKDVAKECQDSLESILQNTEKVNSIVSEIATASTEQSEGIQEITRAMSQLDQVTQQNTAIANDVTSYSTELNDQSVDLETMANRLSSLIHGINKETSFKNSEEETEDVIVKDILSHETESLKTEEFIESKDNENSHSFEEQEEGNEEFEEKVDEVEEVEQSNVLEFNKNEPSLVQEAVKEEKQVTKKVSNGNDVELATTVPDSNDPRFEDF